MRMRLCSHDADRNEGKGEEGLPVCRRAIQTYMDRGLTRGLGEAGRKEAADLGSVALCVGAAAWSSHEI